MRRFKAYRIGHFRHRFIGTRFQIVPWPIEALISLKYLFGVKPVIFLILRFTCLSLSATSSASWKSVKAGLSISRLTISSILSTHLRSAGVICISSFSSGVASVAVGAWLSVLPPGMLPVQQVIDTGQQFAGRERFDHIIVYTNSQGHVSYLPDLPGPLA